jgi:hypothetical protein
MTKGEAIDAKILLGQMDIDSAIDVSKIDKLSDPLDDAYTLEKVVVKTKRQNKKMKARIRR